MDEVIELSQVWKVIKKSLIWMIVLGILGGVGAFAVVKYAIAPKYASSVALLVNRKSDTGAAAMQYNNQQADVQLINTYKDIITKPVILKQVVHNLTTPHKQKTRAAAPAKITRAWNDATQQYEEVVVKPARPAVYRMVDPKYLSADINADKLADEVTISNETNSQVFMVTVTDENAVRARDIAREIASVFKKDIVTMMSIKNVSTVSEASVNKKPVSPNVKLFVLAGVFLGIVMAFLIFLLRELTDRTVKSMEFLSEDLGLVNLGAILFIGKMNKRHVAKQSNSRTTRRATKRV